MKIKNIEPILLYACCFAMFVIISADKVSDNHSGPRFYIALLILVAGGAFFWKFLIPVLPMKLHAILYGLIESISLLLWSTFGAITYHRYTTMGIWAVYEAAVLYFIVTCFSFKKNYRRFIDEKNTPRGYRHRRGSGGDK